MKLIGFDFVQGGFAGKNCEFWAATKNARFRSGDHFHRADTDTDAIHDAGSGMVKVHDAGSGMVIISTHIVDDGSDKMVKLCSFYPSDSNTLQTFYFKDDPTKFENSTSENMVSELKIIFNDSTDFYGRIIVYQMNLICDEVMLAKVT